MRPDSSADGSRLQSPLTPRPPAPARADSCLLQRTRQTFYRRPPTNQPKLKVTAEAATPSNTCLPPDFSKGAPVVSVMPIPTRNRPQIPNRRLISTANQPLLN